MKEEEEVIVAGEKYLRQEKGILSDVKLKDWICWFSETAESLLHIDAAKTKCQLEQYLEDLGRRNQ